MNYGSASVGFILIDGYNLLGNLTEINDGGDEAILDDRTALGDAWKRAVQTGSAQTSLEQSGFFEDGLLGLHEALKTGQGQKRIFCYGLTGNVVGGLMVAFNGTVQSKYNKVIQIQKLTLAKASYIGAGVREEGVVVKPWAQVNATGDTKATPHDHGAASAAGGAIYLHVTELTGPSHLAVKVVHSVDGVTWTDLAAFSDVTSIPAKERIAVAGTINRYTAAVYTFTGAGTATPFVGLVRN